MASWIAAQASDEAPATFEWRRSGAHFTTNARWRFTCRLLWKILHERVRYEERGPAVSVEAKKVRARKMIRERRSLGYRVELLTPPAGNPA